MAISISDIQFYCIFFFIWLISTLLLRSIFKKYTKTTKYDNLHLPPSPPRLPIIGHIHLLSFSLYNSLQTISSKYGHILYLHVGPFPFLLVSSASIATEIFKTHDISFAARPKPPFEDSILFGAWGFVTASYGEYWRFMKKLCVTELLGVQQLERSRSARREELERFFHRLVEKVYKGEFVDVGSEAMKLTNNAICRMAMSTRCSEEDDEAEKIRELVQDSFLLAAKMCLAKALGPLKKLGFGKSVVNASKRYDELMEKILKQHEERAKKEGFKREDLMDNLLEVAQDNKTEFKITRNHIKAFFVDIFIGGTDTSALTTQWAMAELINHPKVFKKVREEIESIIGRSRLVEESDVQNLPYLQAVVKETLRLHPPAPIIPRVCLQSCKIGGFDIPENTAVAINVYAIMRDPDSWDSPNEFFPDRFLISSKNGLKLDYVENESNGQSLNFLPFGAGRRGCPGSNLAFMLTNPAIATMVQCFDWKVGGDHGKEAQVNMQGGIGMSLSMAHSLKCIPALHFNPLAA